MSNDVRNASYPKSDYDTCDHVWREKIDSQFSNEGEADVECVKCKCPGARNRKTLSTFWPAT